MTTKQQDNENGLMVNAIIALICVFIGWFVLGIPLCIIALILSIKVKNEAKTSSIKTLGMVSMVASIVSLVIGILGLLSGF